MGCDAFSSMVHMNSAHPMPKRELSHGLHLPKNFASAAAHRLAYTSTTLLPHQGHTAKHEGDVVFLAFTKYADNPEIEMMDDEGCLECRKTF